MENGNHEDDDNFDEYALQFADPLKHFTGIKEITCTRCKNRFERDYEIYRFTICPECLEREKADRKRELAKVEMERAKGGLDLCKICKRFFRSSLKEIAPKICPECLQGGSSE